MMHGQKKALNFSVSIEFVTVSLVNLIENGLLGKNHENMF
jgi:hypothetical protein